jgi:hypothetical protein
VCNLKRILVVNLNYLFLTIVVGGLNVDLRDYLCFLIMAEEGFF